MVNRVDGVILGVGVIVLVASILGVVLYDEEGGQTFTVSWAEGEATTLDEQSDSGGPGEYTFQVPVNGTLIADVGFTIDVAANGAQVSDDNVSVAVEGPTGQTGSCAFTISATGGQNSCQTTISVNEQPEGFSLTAQNRTAAEQMAIDRVASGNGTGVWNVTVTVDGGTELQEPSYSITVTPTVTEWNPEVQIPTTGPGPGPG